MKNKLRTLLTLTPLALLLSGCPTFSLVSPSFTYNNNFNAGNGNPNEISCDDGHWYSSAYCSIPITKFIAISTHYADPYYVNLPMGYAAKNNTFFFDDISQKSTIVALNKEFLAHYPSTDLYANLPTSLQNLYAQMKEDYIPNNNYQKLMEAYIYLYTISILHFATTSCNEPDLKYPLSESQLLLQENYVFYKAFAMQFTNDVLLHISSSVDGTYKNEAVLYDKIYAQVLKLDPYQLNNLAQTIYERTEEYQPSFESSFYTIKGISFGELGSFSCTKEGTIWYRFGFEFFGSNVAGLPRVVKFKNRDVYKDADDTVIPVQESTSTTKLMPKESNY